LAFDDARNVKKKAIYVERESSGTITMLPGRKKAIEVPSSLSL
jgi:hypothetical protein